MNLRSRWEKKKKKKAQKFLFIPPMASPSLWPRDSLRPLAGGIPPAPPPAPISPLCLTGTPAETSTVAIHAAHHWVMILEADDKGALCSREKNVWAENLGTVVPSGQHFSHSTLTSPPPHSSQHLVCARTRLLEALGEPLGPGPCVPKQRADSLNSPSPPEPPPPFHRCLFFLFDIFFLHCT